MPRVTGQRKNQALFVTLILLDLLITVAAVSRHKRYLVYPDGGPARAQLLLKYDGILRSDGIAPIFVTGDLDEVHLECLPRNEMSIDGNNVFCLQFILGLGIPVDLKEASVTVGTVIKFQYDLPTNSTEYTSRIYGFANTIASRDMAADPDVDNLENQIDEDDSRKLGDDGNFIEEDREDNDTLVDITFNENRRRRRSLAFAEGGAINDVDITGVNTELPLQEAIERQEKIDQNYQEEQEPQRMNRWDFYKILEHMSERYGYSGRPCLLRTICEAAEVPFTHENGLLAEIGHILFTPSTTKDTLSHHTDNEYHAAEQLGRHESVDCETMFPECEGSILETFTEIGENTLHSFGF